MAPAPLPPSDRVDERRLVDSARRDPDAFAELYRRYVERIHAYAYRRSGSRVVAEDVTSATFEKALRGLPKYRWREPGIGPWLFQIASNELINVYRGDSKQGRIMKSLISERPGLTDIDAAFNDRSELIDALGRIRPRYQRALMLRYFADLSNEEAAEAMGVSRSTMAVIVHRGTTALRKAIEATRSTEEVGHDR